MYISLWENSRGHPDNVSFMQFSTKIDGFEQKDSQGFENSYNSYEQYPLEKFFMFTIYQNYTLALRYIQISIGAKVLHVVSFLFCFLQGKELHGKFLLIKFPDNPIDHNQVQNNKNQEEFVDLRFKTMILRKNQSSTGNGKAKNVQQQQQQQPQPKHSPMQSQSQQ